MSNIKQENDIKNMLIKIVDSRIKEIPKPLSPTVIIKCTQSQYETWEINGQIDINKLYGIIIEEW